MKYLVVTDGKDPLSEPVLDYLDRVYGMPAGDIRGFTVESQVGEVLTITVTVMVRKNIPDPL